MPFSWKATNELHRSLDIGYEKLAIGERLVVGYSALRNVLSNAFYIVSRLSTERLDIHTVCFSFHDFLKPDSARESNVTCEQ